MLAKLNSSISSSTLLALALRDPNKFLPLYLRTKYENCRFCLIPPIKKKKETKVKGIHPNLHLIVSIVFKQLPIIN
jgi:hypothetical protein